MKPTTYSDQVSIGYICPNCEEIAVKGFRKVKDMPTHLQCNKCNAIIGRKTLNKTKALLVDIG